MVYVFQMFFSWDRRSQGTFSAVGETLTTSLKIRLCCRRGYRMAKRTMSIPGLISLPVYPQSDSLPSDRTSSLQLDEYRSDYKSQLGALE